jgi:hypothetical protein
MTRQVRSLPSSTFSPPLAKDRPRRASRSDKLDPRRPVGGRAGNTLEVAVAHETEQLLADVRVPETRFALLHAAALYS